MVENWIIGFFVALVSISCCADGLEGYGKSGDMNELSKEHYIKLSADIFDYTSNQEYEWYGTPENASGWASVTDLSESGEMSGVTKGFSFYYGHRAEMGFSEFSISYGAGTKSGSINYNFVYDDDPPPFSSSAEQDETSYKLQYLQFFEHTDIADELSNESITFIPYVTVLLNIRNIDRTENFDETGQTLTGEQGRETNWGSAEMMGGGGIATTSIYGRFSGGVRLQVAGGLGARRMEDSLELSRSDGAGGFSWAYQLMGTLYGDVNLGVGSFFGEVGYMTNSFDNNTLSGTYFRLGARCFW
jgi:hypothetical protein